MSKKKQKAVRFSKKQIAEAKAKSDWTVLQPLLERYMSHDPKMSMAEKDAASSMIKAIRPKDSIVNLNPANFLNGRDKVFTDLFLAYYQDFEGERGIFKFSEDLRVRDRLVPIAEKREDVIKLNEFYKDWETKFTKSNHKGDVLLNTIITEVNDVDLKPLEKEYKEGKLTKAEYEYKRKGTILRSKYLYNKIKTVFEERKGKNVEIKFAGKIIEITLWTMVHVLNRHYAGRARQLDIQKSFHQDPNLKFFEDPEVLKSVLEEIGSHPSIQKNGVKFIPFKLNSVVYSIYTESQKKDNGSSFIRIQTFYPAEEKSDLDKIRNEYKEVTIREQLIGYQEI